MKVPIITGIYAAILMLIYVALSLNVVRLRRGNQVSMGDGGNVELRCAIRAHAHFAEYVPFALLLIAIIEMSSASRIILHILLATLLVARLLHPMGMFAKPGTFQFTTGRVLGMALTMIVMVVTALVALQRFLLPV